MSETKAARRRRIAIMEDSHNALRGRPESRAAARRREEAVRALRRAERKANPPKPRPCPAYAYSREERRRAEQRHRRNMTAASIEARIIAEKREARAEKQRRRAVREAR